MLEMILSTERFSVWAREYARSVARAYDPDCIILFGSTVRNQQTRNSDIDILIIGGNLPDTYRTRFRLLMRLRPAFAPLQVQTFTRQEWERMMDEKHVTVLEALQEGVALHGQALFARWRQTFQDWRQLGLRRTACTWVIPPALRAQASYEQENR
jgi:predicted nucleotidyltransferase